MLGRARFTEDIDAIFLLSIQDIPNFLRVAREEGIEPRIESVAEFARKSGVMLMKYVPSDTTLQLRLPTPEDLIIMKAIAHRPKDLEDIRTIADK